MLDLLYAVNLLFLHCQREGWDWWWSDKEVRKAITPFQGIIPAFIYFMYLHRASWHSSATLTKGFPCFSLSWKANARVKLAKTGHGLYSTKIFVLLYVLFVLCHSVYCLCVNVYCTTATRWLPNHS